MTLWPRAPRSQAPRPLRLANFLHNQVIGIPSRLTAPSRLATNEAPGPLLAAGTWSVPTERLAPLVAVVLVGVPVFLQAPWVRAAPLAAALFTVPLMALAILLERRSSGPSQELGALLMGFSGSWLGGSLFWGWARLHPLWHLPIEAFALPLAVAGLGSRWRMSGAFYLASLLGTAATDGAIALTGLMDLWPQVLKAPLTEAPLLLQEAGARVLEPQALCLILPLAALLVATCRQLWRAGGIGRVSAATLAATLAVDGLFLGASLVAPRLSGLI